MSRFDICKECDAPFGSHRCPHVRASEPVSHISVDGLRSQEKARTWPGSIPSPAVTEPKVGRWQIPGRSWVCACPANLVSAYTRCPECGSVRPEVPAAAPKAGEREGIAEAKDLLALFRLAAMDGYNAEPISTVDEWAEEARKRILLLYLAGRRDASPPPASGAGTPEPTWPGGMKHATRAHYVHALRTALDQKLGGEYVAAILRDASSLASPPSLDAVTDEQDGALYSTPDPRTYPKPLRDLGERLTELLDDDKWNNVEPMLHAVAALIPPRTNDKAGM